MGLRHYFIVTSAEKVIFNGWFQWFSVPMVEQSEIHFGNVTHIYYMHTFVMTTYKFNYYRYFGWAMIIRLFLSRLTFLLLHCLPFTSFSAFFPSFFFFQLFLFRNLFSLIQNKTVLETFRFYHLDQFAF